MRPSLGLLALPLLLIAANRDPFWPIGWDPSQEVVEVEPTPSAPTPTPTPEVRELTDEELRQLAKEEAERIRSTLTRDATMIANGKVFAFIGGNWVSKGDNFEVEVMGRTYRLEILSLSAEDIQLEAHRMDEAP